MSRDNLTEPTGPSAPAKCEASELSVPNDHKYLPVVAAYVNAVATRQGLSEEKSTAVQNAVVDVARFVMDHGFDPHERGSIVIQTERALLGMKVAVRDTGLPWEAAWVENELRRGDSFARVRECADETAFHNLGIRGKEITVVKYALERNVADYFDICALQTHDTPTVSEPVDFTVRDMAPTEAIEISRNFFRAYGYSYACPHVYFPDQIAELAREGSVRFAVAETSAGGLAGHCALIKQRPDSRIVEMGMAATQPRYRSQGIFNRLASFLLDKAKSEELMGVYGQAVTNHTFTQQADFRLGLRDCAVLAGYIPATERFKGITEQLPQRETLLVQFKYLHVSSQSPVYAPAKHADMIARIYENLGADALLAPCPRLTTSDVPAVVSVTPGPPGTARIQVDAWGDDIVEEVGRLVRELKFSGVEVVHLYVDLSDPRACAHTGGFEELGFFFAGVLPGACKGDAMILQLLDRVFIEYGNLKIFSEFGRELVRYVEAQDPHRL